MIKRCWEFETHVYYSTMHLTSIFCAFESCKYMKGTVLFSVSGVKILVEAFIQSRQKNEYSEIFVSPTNWALNEYSALCNIVYVFKDRNTSTTDHIKCIIFSINFI